MSAKGSWVSDATASQLIVPANPYREKLVIQQRTITAAHYTNVAFGEDAIVGSGYQLRTAGAVLAVAGALARLAVYAICTSGGSATGGYQENLGICSEV